MSWRPFETVGSGTHGTEMPFLAVKTDVLSLQGRYHIRAVSFSLGLACLVLELGT